MTTVEQRPPLTQDRLQDWLVYFVEGGMGGVGVARISVAILLGVALASCSDHGPEKKGADTANVSKVFASATTAVRNVDPCAYISVQEVSAITTDKVTSATASGASCTYHAAPDDGVEVTIHIGDGVKRMQVTRASLGLLDKMGKAVGDKGGAGADTEALLQKDTHQTPGLGDEAVWGVNTTLSVRKGDVFVEVTPPIMHDPATHAGYPLVRREEKRKIAEQIAEKILAKAAP
jgi:hypothetical protein